MQISTIGNTVPPAQWNSANGVSGSASAVAPPSAAPVQTAAAVEPVARPATAGEAKQALQDINRVMRELSRGLEFSIDPDSDQVIVKVVDQTTSEIIRQMPTKEALEIAKALDKVQGLLIKQQA
jgi:flagellar protein FlaG